MKVLVDIVSRSHVWQNSVRYGQLMASCEREREKVVEALGDIPLAAYVNYIHVYIVAIRVLSET